MASEQVELRFTGQQRSAVAAARAVRDELRGLGTDARRAHSLLRPLGAAASVAFRAAAVGATAAAAAVAFVGFRFNDLKQRSQIAFETMLGSGQKAARFLEDLRKFAARTPFEFPDLIRASQRLVALGFESKQVIPVMTAVGNAVAGMGGDPQALEATIRAIGQIQSKGRLMAEEMMQLNEAGTFSWKALADAIGTSVPKAMELVTKGAVTADIFLQAFMANSERRFAGMMERQSHTFSGLISTAKDTFAQLSGTVMQPFFDEATKGLQFLVDKSSGPEFTAGAERFAEVWSKKVHKAIGDTVGFFRRNWDDIVDFLRQSWEMAKAFASAARDIAREVNGVIQKLGGWETAAKFILTGLMARRIAGIAIAFKGLAGPKGIGAAIIAAGGLRGSLLKLVKNPWVIAVTLAVSIVGLDRARSAWLNFWEGLPGIGQFFERKSVAFDAIAAQVRKAAKAVGAATAPLESTQEAIALGSYADALVKAATRGKKPAGGDGTSAIDVDGGGEGGSEEELDRKELARQRSRLRFFATHLDKVISEEVQGKIQKRLKMVRAALTKVTENEDIDAISNRLDKIGDIYKGAIDKQQERARGAAEKFRERMKERFATIREETKKAMEDYLSTLRETVDVNRSSFASAFGRLADKAFEVFDAKTSDLVRKARARVAAFGFEIGEGELTPGEAALAGSTPAEQALAELRGSRAASARAEAMSAANAALRAAKTPEEKKAARRALNELLLDEQERGLEEQVTVERNALEEQARLERTAADEALARRRQEIEDERRLTREKVEARIAEIQTGIETEKLTVAEGTTQLRTLLEEYDVSFETAGALVGSAFATGFLTALEEVDKKISELWASIGILKKAEPGPKASMPVHAPWVPGVGFMPGFQHGGPVGGHYVNRQDTILGRLTPGEYVESRAERAWIERGGGGRPVINLNFKGANFYGSSKREAEAWIGQVARREIPRIIGLTR